MVPNPQPSNTPIQASVVLATYNGEQWLPAQLDSLLQQDRQPDQVVITDDGSTDATPEIVEDFVSRAPFEVRVLRRDSPIGYTENFVGALSACHGDVVFFCDQDDVWFPEKLSTVLDVIGATGASLVVHDQAVVDEQLRPHSYSMLERFQRAGLSWDLHRKGCATAARSSFLRSVLPVRPGFSFDNWFHDVAAAAEQRLVIPDVLMAYRVHGDNTSRFRLNRLEPPRRRNAGTAALVKARSRLGWFVAPVAVIEQQACEREAVIEAAYTFLQDAAPASRTLPQHLQRLAAEARLLHRRARRRQSSIVWRRLYHLLAPFRQ